MFSKIRKLLYALLHFRILRNSALFDNGYYLQENPDVALSGKDPVWHFLLHGSAEGRNPSAFFDTSYYLSANPDVRAAGVNPLVHYLACGKSEGRLPLPPAPAVWEPEPSRDRSNPCGSSCPLVSVIVPCYNDGKYLEETVASLRAQTYPSLELIVIDDGSDDPHTLDVLHSLAFPSLQILHTDHIRPAGARNTGIRAASGQYILPLDSDDTIEPEYIELAVAEMERDENVGIVYCHADVFGEASGPWELPDYSFRQEIMDNCIFVTALFRKSDWERAGGFCEEYLYGMEDYDFWLSILSLGRTVVQLPASLFHYRIKPRSRTTDFNGDYGHVQQTYRMLYERHRTFFGEHMDLYCTELRSALIDQLFRVRNLEAELTADPTAEWWKQFHARHGRLAELLIRCFPIKGTNSD